MERSIKVLIVTTLLLIFCFSVYTCQRSSGPQPASPPVFNQVAEDSSHLAQELPQSQEQTESNQNTPAASAYYPAGPLIVVDKTNFTVTRYVNGQAEIRYTCAIGKHSSETETPEGKFFVIDKKVNPYYVEEQIPGGEPDNPLGTRWIGLNTGINSENSIGIHGTNEPGSLGSAASLGCVRLANDQVAELFDKVSIGEPVWIGTETMLSAWGLGLR